MLEKAAEMKVAGMREAAGVAGAEARVVAAGMDLAEVVRATAAEVKGSLMVEGVAEGVEKEAGKVAGKEAVRDQVTAVATVVEKVMAMAGGVERAVRREGVTEAAVVDQSSLCKHIWRLQRPTMRR